jgi:hypothetical protein
MRKISRTSWLLIGNIATLLGAGVLSFVEFLPRQILPDESQGEVSATVAHVGGLALSSAADIEQFPIFSRSRRPIPEVPATLPAVPAPALESPELIGIVGETGRLWAVLENPSDKTRKALRQGETFAGWTAVSVHATTVQLKAAERTVTLNVNAPERAAIGIATKDETRK